MKLTVLGSGCGIPRKSFASPAYIVEIGNYIFSVDMGPGALRQAECAGYSFYDIDAILLTHRHVDHACDLPAFFFAARNKSNPRTKPLLISGPDGTADFISALRTAWEGQLDCDEYEVNVIDFPLDIEGFYSELKDIKITTMPMKHSRPAIGYRFESEGKILTMGGDSEACPELIELSRNANLFVADCSFPHTCVGHMNPEEAGCIASEANAKKILLSHFYPQMNPEEAVSTASKYFSGNIESAEDGKMIEI